jgi:hypothetical protein
MPDPKRYTVRDPESGRTVTFAWSGDAPPTDDDIAEVFAAAPQGDAPLTRDRQVTGAPSAMSPGHHPDTTAGAPEGLRELFNMTREDMPSDAAFLKRGPEVGGTAGMVFGGPIGAGAGAALGSLAKGQYERGAHVPTGGEAGAAALDGGFSALLAGAPSMAMGAARVAGPAIAKVAPRVGRAAQTVSGGGFGASVMSGNIPAMLTTGATAIATDPRVIRGVGNLVGRAGNSPTLNAIANKAGLGMNLTGGAEAFRKALLDALGAESSASTDR